MSNKPIVFEAEVVEVKAKKSASTDKEISLRLITDNEAVLALQAAISKDIVKVEVTL